MRLFSELIFDDMIVNPGVRYTSSKFNALLGKADQLAIVAITTGVSGSPTLELEVESSADGRKWVATGDFINVTSAESKAYYLRAGLFPSLLSLVRLEIDLETSGSCHLKIYATGRAL